MKQHAAAAALPPGERSERELSGVSGLRLCAKVEGAGMVGCAAVAGYATRRTKPVACGLAGLGEVS